MFVCLFFIVFFLLYSLFMRLIVSTVYPHPLTIQSHVLSIFALKWLIFMALFWAATWRRFSFSLNISIYVFSCAIKPVCHWKYPNSWFSSHFCFLFIYLFIFVLQSVLTCLWCNGYRRRKWTRRYEFKSWTRLTAFHIALIPLGKVWIQLFSLQLWANTRTDWVHQPWWVN